MTGSSSMLTGRIRWFTFLLLLPALLGMGGEALPWITPSALAVGKHLENTSGDCKGGHHQPSFGGTIVVDTGEVVCGDLNFYAGGWARGDGSQLNVAHIDHTRHIELLFFSSSDFHVPFWPILN